MVVVVCEVGRDLKRWRRNSRSCATSSSRFVFVVGVVLFVGVVMGALESNEDVGGLVVVIIVAWVVVVVCVVCRVRAFLNRCRLSIRSCARFSSRFVVVGVGSLVGVGVGAMQVVGKFPVAVVVWVRLLVSAAMGEAKNCSVVAAHSVVVVVWVWIRFARRIK